MWNVSGRKHTQYAVLLFLTLALPHLGCQLQLAHLTDVSTPTSTSSSNSSNDSSTLNPSVFVLPAPSYLSSNPASPSNSTSPLIKGSSPSDTATIKLYRDSTCTIQIGSGTKEAWEGAGISATVTPNASTAIYAQAVDSTGNISDCTLLVAAYVNDNTAPTNPIFSAPSSTVTQATTAYTFQWNSNDGGTGIDHYTYSIYNTSNCTGGVLVSGTASSGGYAGTLTHLSNSLSVTAYDGAGNASSAVCSSNVKYNRDPVATNDTLIVAKNAAATPVSVLANDTDADGDTLSIANITQPTNGTTAISGNNVNYTPNSNFYGVDTFTYTIQDTSGGTATGTVTVKVMTPFTWTGVTGDGKWSTGGNWCGTVTAGACPGGAAPSSTTTTTHIAVFNGTCTYCNAGIDVNASAYRIELNTGYAGTLTQNSTRTISIGAGGYSQAAGTFTGGDANITLLTGSSLSLSGGTFTSTSATLAIYRNFTVSNSPTFNHSNGLVKFTGDSSGTSLQTSSITPGTVVFNNVTFIKDHLWSGSYNISVTGTMTVNGNLTLDATNYVQNLYQVTGGTITLAGNLTANKAYGGTTLIKLVGSNNQTVTGVSGGILPKFEIAKSGGTATLVGNIDVEHNWTYTSGIVDSGTSTVKFWSYASTDQTSIISSGSMAFNNVTFAKYLGWSGDRTITVTGTMIVNGNLTLAPTGTQNYPMITHTGTITVAGNLTASGGGTLGGSATIKLVGSGNQTVAGSAGCILPNFVIAKSGGTATLTGTIDVERNWTYTSGIVDSGTSTVRFLSNYALVTSSTINSGSMVFNNVVFAKSTYSGNTDIIITGTMTVAGNLTLARSSPTYTHRLYGGTLAVAGNVTGTDVGNSGSTASIVFNGSIDQTLSYTAGTWPSGNVTVTKGGGSLILANNISWNATGQSLNVTAGTINMNGKNLTVKSAITLNGNTIQKNAGILTVNSVVQGTGAILGGTVTDP